MTDNDLADYYTQAMKFPVIYFFSAVFIPAIGLYSQAVGLDPSPHSDNTEKQENPGPSWDANIEKDKKETAPKPKTDYWDLDSIPKDSYDKLIENYSKESNWKRLKQIHRFFGKAITLFQNQLKALDELQSKSQQKSYPHERYKWQVKDRLERQKKYFNRMKRKIHRDYLHMLNRAIVSIGKIKNPEVRENDFFKKLKRDIFREAIKVNLYLKNYLQAIPILEEYISIAPKNEDQPFKLLYKCYDHLEKFAKKSGKSIEEIRQYRSKKLDYWLQYIALRYGKDSIEYLKALDRAEREKSIVY